MDQPRLAPTNKTDLYVDMLKPCLTRAIGSREYGVMAVIRTTIRRARTAARHPKATVERVMAIAAGAALAGQPAPLRGAVLSLWDEIKIAGRSRRAVKQFRRLSGRRNLRVHLGCGLELKSGWLNVDLNLDRSVLNITADMAPDTMFINYDLRRGTLPLDDGSCDLIYSAHFFEHLECEHGARLMRDCYRLLRPAGTFRVALPTFKASFRAYVQGDVEFFAPHNMLEVLPYLEPGTEALVDRVNYSVYQRGEHKCIYDEEKTCLLLRHIGFTSVGVSAYDESIDPTSEVRRRHSFYVEAVR